MNPQYFVEKLWEIYPHSLLNQISRKKLKGKGGREEWGSNFEFFLPPVSPFDEIDTPLFLDF